MVNAGSVLENPIISSFLCAGRCPVAGREDGMGWIAGLIRGAGNCVTHTEEKQRKHLQASYPSEQLSCILRKGKELAPSAL